MLSSTMKIDSRSAIKLPARPLRVQIEDLAMDEIFLDFMEEAHARSLRLALFNPARTKKEGLP
jgi:hypothetical protein